MEFLMMYFVSLTVQVTVVEAYLIPGNNNLLRYIFLYFSTPGSHLRYHTVPCHAVCQLVHLTCQGTLRNTAHNSDPTVKIWVIISIAAHRGVVTSPEPVRSEPPHTHSDSQIGVHSFPTLTVKHTLFPNADFKHLFHCQAKYDTPDRCTYPHREDLPCCSGVHQVQPHTV